MLPLVYRRRSLDLNFEFEAGFGRRVRRSLAADSGPASRSLLLLLSGEIWPKYGRPPRIILALSQ